MYIVVYMYILMKVLQDKLNHSNQLNI